GFCTAAALFGAAAIGGVVFAVGPSARVADLFTLPELASGAKGRSQADRRRHGASSTAKDQLRIGPFKGVFMGSGLPETVGIQVGLVPAVASAPSCPAKDARRAVF